MVFQGKEIINLVDIFDKAVEIAISSPSDIDSFLDCYVNSILDKFNNSISRKEAVYMAKTNLTICSSYYNHEIIDLVVKSYSIQHPIENLV